MKAHGLKFIMSTNNNTQRTHPPSLSVEITMTESSLSNIDRSPFKTLLTRNPVYIRSWLTLGTLGLMGALFGYITYTHVLAIRRDGPWYALIFLLYPLGAMYVSFPLSTITGNLWIIFGSIRCLERNSTYYSAQHLGVAPSPINPLYGNMSTMAMRGSGSPSLEEEKDVEHSGRSMPGPLNVHLASMNRARSTPMPLLLNSFIMTPRDGAGAAVPMVSITGTPPKRSLVHMIRERSVASLHDALGRAGVTSPVVVVSDTALLPPVIIQMPVYKESLRSVIIPSCESLLVAIAAYEAVGGVADLLVCDDGLCGGISGGKAQARVKYYHDNSITYIGRPKENRAGTFKKASNLNYAYRACEVYGNMGDGLRCSRWSLQPIPDDALILLVDADTRVPPSCIVDTVTEFMGSDNKRLAFTQHFTTPFDIYGDDKSNYWLKIISYFTEKIYFMGIAFSTALGGACPLVGHNAFIRYRCIRELGGWNEHCVSEDFDLFLRLAYAGYHGRFVMYTGPEFQEGVSTTFIDEVRKFQRFTYGACEMVVNPLWKWPCAGPFAHGFLKFLGSGGVSWHDKCNTLFYLCTYFAMATAFYFTVAEGVCNVVVPGFYDVYMSRAFDVMIGCLVVFGGVSTLAQVAFDIKAFKYPSGTSVILVLWDEVKWIPFIAIFFSSVMFHMTETSFRYFFGLPVKWGATNKSSVHQNVLGAIWGTMKELWLMYVVVSILLGAYIFCDVYWDLPMYYSWTIYYYGVAHLVGPLLLNPNVMLFRI